MSSPGAAGTSGYSGAFYKTQQDAAANPRAYANANQNVTMALNELGLPESWREPVLEIVARESSFNPGAANPKSSAKGLFQFLDGTRKNYGDSNVNWNDPYQQTVAGLKYIKDRYGDPIQALNYWDAHKSY